ncbi:MULTISPECIES: AMP-binding protein [unclassified Streptomyces]|uniref:AMP-binding protein n=1 Tax=unclassified Streptomyces TaxID=2593676 RepID=UPI00224FB968|nr:AMP-binding protein [Streptomyces sp. NBC_01551]MCX4529768.1 AMP-binding protein [Streptomyces sp. NBC_01551]
MTQGSESTRSGSRTTDSVLDRFERLARDAPEAYALIAGPASLTYGQLDARANQLAHHLLAAGLPPGGLVALGTARQSELVVALLGILKAGGHGAVVDVESGVGQRQLAHLEPFAVLTHAAHHPRLDDGRGLRFIRLDAEAAAIAAHPADPPAREPGLLALRTLTGGPEPRSVALTHDTLLDAFEGWSEVARLTPADRHLITAGPDATAFATGWTRALCSGGALVLPERGPWTAGAIRRAVETEQVTVVHTDPGGATQLLARDAGAVAARELRKPDAALRHLRLVTVTGDRLFLDEQADLQSRLRAGARVLGVYGLAETAGTGTWFDLAQLPAPQDDPERRALIGTPFPGFRADLRDGQICLTPPGAKDAIPTGDLGVLRPDGLLEFAGRRRDRLTLDTGESFDPHPVEAMIRTHPGIGGAVLRMVRVPGTTRASRLIAYVAPPPGAPSRVPAPDPADSLPELDGLREHLKGRLPGQWVPRELIRMRSLPRNRAGQENRNAMPLPPRLTDPVDVARGRGKGAGKYTSPPADPTVLVLIGIFWGAVAAVAAGFLFFILSKIFWPGATDLAGVPSPWAFLFFVLYLFEGAAFAAGIAFLVWGRAPMRRQGRPPGATTAAHLAAVYLLVAWWPQDNFYRLAAKQDWPVQAALVYTFNIPLMIAGAVVAYYLTLKPVSPFDFDD